MYLYKKFKKGVFVYGVGDFTSLKQIPKGFPFVEFGYSSTKTSNNTYYGGVVNLKGLKEYLKKGIFTQSLMKQWYDEITSSNYVYSLIKGNFLFEMHKIDNKLSFIKILNIETNELVYEGVELNEIYVDAQKEDFNDSNLIEYFFGDNFIELKRNYGYSLILNLNTKKIQKLEISVQSRYSFKDYTIFIGYNLDMNETSMRDKYEFISKEFADKLELYLTT